MKTMIRVLVVLCFSLVRGWDVYYNTKLGSSVATLEEVFKLEEPRKRIHSMIATKRDELFGVDGPEVVFHVEEDLLEVRKVFRELLRSLNLDDFSEDGNRFRIFQESVKFVIDHNRDPNRTSRLQINPYALLSEEELQLLHGTGSAHDLEKKSEPVLNDDVRVEAGDAEHWDWREYGVATPVGNQMTCGSCWAFAAIGAIEGRMAIENQYLYHLSTQQLVSCFNRDTFGCNGGSFTTALKSFHSPILTEFQFPYAASDTIPCPTSATSDGVVQSLEMRVTRSVENHVLRRLVYRQPVAVALRASNRCFYLYESGVLKDDSCRSKLGPLSHAALLVGYQHFDLPGGAWIVKNSYSKSWGVQGYVYIGIADLDKKPHGNFGINSEVAFPTKVIFANSCFTGNETTRCKDLGQYVNTSHHRHIDGNDNKGQVWIRSLIMVVIFSFWIGILIFMISRFFCKKYGSQGRCCCCCCYCCSRHISSEQIREARRRLLFTQNSDQEMPGCESAPV